jgi:hypothetical protein
MTQGTTTLELTTLPCMLGLQRDLVSITLPQVITEVLTALRLTILIRTVIMGATPIILIMTGLMVVFITGTDIGGMLIIS